jgi:hypothetical protein
MATAFAESRPTREYLENYGSFMLHCGATAMGVPSKEDSHPLHGELPNASYQKAYVVVGQDEKGPYVTRQDLHALARLGAREEPIQTMRLLPGFGHHTLITHQQVGVVGLEQMLAEEEPKHLCPRNERVEETLHGAIAATFAGPPGDA